MHYTLADTVHKTFTTRAFATGIPTVLAGTPVVSAYEDDSVTQITAGITLGVDHDSVVGLNLLTLVLTGANGYEAGKDYNFVITTGTVGGVSVVGETVLSISLDRDPAFVRLGAPAGASVSADIAVIEGQTDDIGVAGAGLTAINLPNQTMDIVGDITGNLSGSVDSVTAINTTGGAIDDVVLVATTTTNTDMRGTDSALLAANINLSVGVVESNLLQMGGVVQSGTDLKDFADAGYDPVTNKVQGVVLVDTTTANTDMRGTDDAAKATIMGTPSDFGSGTLTIAANLEDMADNGSAVFDRSTDSLQAIRDRGDAAWITGLTALGSGTAQGGTATTIQLASAETFGDGDLEGISVKILSGTGAGQARIIISNVGSTDTATIAPNWITNPSSDSVYELVDGSVNLSVFNLGEVTGSIETAADVATAVLTTQMTEAFAADGVAPTLAQAVFLIQQLLGDFGIVGTTLTVRKIDGVTTAAIFTLDDGTIPTDITRTT